MGRESDKNVKYPAHQQTVLFRLHHEMVVVNLLGLITIAKNSKSSQMPRQEERGGKLKLKRRSKSSRKDQEIIGWNLRAAQMKHTQYD